MGKVVCALQNELYRLVHKTVRAHQVAESSQDAINRCSNVLNVLCSNVLSIYVLCSKSIYQSMF